MSDIFDDAPQESIEAINRQGAENIEANFKKLRKDIIDYTTRAVYRYATEQVSAMKEQPQGPIARKVTTSQVGLPFLDDEPQNALKAVLVPNEFLGQRRQGEQRLMLYVPIPAGVVLNQWTDIQALPEPSFVVLERVDAGGEPTGYRISEEEMELFENPFVTGEQRIGWEALGEQALMEFIGSRVSPLYKEAAALSADILNWTAIDQTDQETQA